MRGSTFAEAAPGEVSDFLRSRRMQEFRVAPQNLHISNDGSRLILRMCKGGVSEFPLREAFLLKLLKWHGFPARHVGRLSIDTVCSILNDHLLSIKSSDVTLKVENGEALSLMGGNYNPISDLDVLDLAQPLNVVSISRNDFFTRVYTRIRERFSPVPGDECGLGYNVFNSETGFQALSVHHFILRYLCSNGAIIQSDSRNRQCVHYGHPDWVLRDFLQHEMSEAWHVRKRIINSIEERTRQCCKREIENTKRRLGAFVGKKAALKALKSLDPNPSRYDLANLVTSLARTLGIGGRLEAETLGGELMAGRAAIGDRHNLQERQVASLDHRE